MADIFTKIVYSFHGSLTKRILLDAFALFRDLWVYVAVGILVTVALKLFVSKDQIARFFTKKKHSSIVIAALLGVISPLGTYVAIPLAAGLYQAGTPLGPLAAFMIASPLIDPNLFFLTAGTLGYEMAILRVVSALFLGCAGGYATQRLFGIKHLRKRGSSPIQDIPGEADSSVQKKKSLVGSIAANLYRQTVFIGKYFVPALVLAAVVKNCVSPDWVMKVLGKSRFFSVLFAAGAGIPLYTCGGAAIPVLQELAELGMSKGAILAFFISGPATKVSTLVMMKAAFSLKLFLLYLTVTMTGAVFFGYLYNLFG